MDEPLKLRDVVRAKYGAAARQAREGAQPAGCGCGSSCGCDPITQDLYQAGETAGLPAEAVLASLGCGNPTALAELRPGGGGLGLGAGGEALGVLRPGGRLAVSDVVVRGPVPEEIRRSLELWVGCVAGALEVEEFERLLREVGFEDPSIEPTRIYRVEDARAFLMEAGLDQDRLAPEVGGRMMAAFVRARKPGGAGGPGGGGGGPAPPPPP